MRIVYQHNFLPDDVVDQDWAQLFEHRRRDSAFACVLEDDERYYALRDHLGIVPLHYRWEGGAFHFSLQFTDLLRSGDTLDQGGVQAFVGLGAVRLHPLIQDIQAVPPGSVLALDKRTGQVKKLYQYTVRPRTIPFMTRMDDLVDELDRLFLQAMERIVKTDSIGLYLSGGIDSALIGVYLNRLGININAYTSGPWGKSSSDLPYARRTADLIGVREHQFHYLESADYPHLFGQMQALYGQPHGTRTGLGVAGLWMNTSIEQERQLFFGENNDSLNGSIAAQYLTYFAGWLPLALRKQRLPYADVGRSLIHFASQGYYDDITLLQNVADYATLNRVQRLVLASMYMICMSDSEVLALPAMRAGIDIGDPYYDMDVIEFAMGVPLRHRLQPVRKKIPFVFAKRVFQELLLRYVPGERVYRKKAFTVSLMRDDASRLFYEQQLPVSVEGVALRGNDARFAGGALLQWCQQSGIACDFEAVE